MLCTQVYLSTVVNEWLIHWVTSYEQISCIIIKSPKCDNKYMHLIIHTLWGCDITVPHKGNSHSVWVVSFHQSMSRWGNGEPGNCTHIIAIARNPYFFQKVYPFSSIWNKSYNLVIMTALQIAPRTRTKLVEANQCYYHFTQCSLSPGLTLVESKSTNPTSTSYEVVSLLWWPVDLSGHMNYPPGPRSLM